MSYGIELCRRRKASWPRSNNGNLVTTTNQRGRRLDPSFSEPPVYNCVFYVLDCDRWLDNTEHTRPLAGCRTSSSCEFGKIVGLMQSLKCIAPAAPVNQIIPFRNEIVDRAAGLRLAKRDTTVHTPAALIPQLIHQSLGMNFIVVRDAYTCISVRDNHPRGLFESS